MVNKIVKTTGDLTLGSLSIGFGAAVAGKLPASPATAAVQQGFTTFARFTPTFATLGAFDVIQDQFKSIKKKVKGGKI